MGIAFLDDLMLVLSMKSNTLNRDSFALLSEETIEKDAAANGPITLGVNATDADQRRRESKGIASHVLDKFVKSK